MLQPSCATISSIVCVLSAFSSQLLIVVVNPPPFDFATPQMAARLLGKFDSEYGVQVDGVTIRKEFDTDSLAAGGTFAG